MTRINFKEDTPMLFADVLLDCKNIKKKVRMAIDTGATYMMVPWEVAESLGLEPEISKKRIDIITASGIEKVPVVTFPFVSVGKSDARNIETIIHDLPPKSYVDGLLGLSFLRNFKLIIDFKEVILN